ncbi:hypothetical protein ACLOJK_000840 [Asimina triloba]
MRFVDVEDRDVEMGLWLDLRQIGVASMDSYMRIEPCYWWFVSTIVMTKVVIRCDVDGILVGTTRCCRWMGSIGRLSMGDVFPLLGEDDGVKMEETVRWRYTVVEWMGVLVEDKRPNLTLKRFPQLSRTHALPSFSPKHELLSSVLVLSWHQQPTTYLTIHTVDLTNPSMYHGPQSSIVHRTTESTTLSHHFYAFPTQSRRPIPAPIMPPPLLVFLLLAPLSLAVHSLTLPSDVSVLVSFKSSIAPSSIQPWSCLATWNFSFDPCTAPRRTHFVCGLTCTPDSTRVESIVLDPAGYSGTLTPLLSRLTQLTHLDLSENAFHGQIPPTLFTLPNLLTLTLRSNSLSGNLPPFSKLPSLQSIDISRNALGGTIPASIKTLTSLRFLDLSFNRLAGPIPRLPPNLAQLALKANSLSGPLSEASFTGLNGLEVVELSANRLYGTLKGWLFLLPTIQQVDLANNSLTGAEIWSAGGRDIDLVAVDLGFNQLEGDLPANFATFPRLLALSLRYNRLRGAIPAEYGKGRIKRLYLDGNFLNGSVPSEFLVGGSPVSGSFGYNCLQGCPSSVQLCVPAQKPASVCKQVYGRKSGAP